MVLQDQAPSTMEKYIIKLAENVLCDYHNGLSIVELSKKIQEAFNLSFTTEEIKIALRKKSNKTIEYNGTVFYLNSRRVNDLVKTETISDKLKLFVGLFLSQNKEINVSSMELEHQIISYLYFCFNSNVNNLLNLLNKNEKQIQYNNEGFDFDSGIVNKFIEWDNDDKNKFIYQVVATCYEYCMLTVKNDNIISKQLFYGKRFFLDSNIIFRLAGINKDERSIVTSSFIEHCKRIGIKLCCTSVTYDEIYRVVDSQISRIKYLTTDAPPVSPNKLAEIDLNYEVNDFYNIYYEWSQKEGNNYDDYLTFNNYLIELLSDAIKKVDIITISKEKYSLQNKFAELSANLRNYKNERNKWKVVSQASSDTDIVNIQEILDRRSKNSESIWQTNDFIVSADQQLIAWTLNTYSGVPIVVLPSVWLSIILRFTGRTSDDYNSFCLFLTQREHHAQLSSIDPPLFVKKINEKTNNEEIKNRIIQEVVNNKSAYSFAEETDYDANIDKAFDKVVEEFKAENDKRFIQLQDDIKSQMSKLSEDSQQLLLKEKERNEQQSKIIAQNEREKTILLLAKEKARQRVKIFSWISKNDWVCYVVGVIGLT